MRPLRALVLVTALLTTLLGLPPEAPAAPEGRMTWAVHISIAPTFFDPAESPGIITPFMIYYALHDALVKPMPGQTMAPSLAESWTTSKDGLTYEFVLRKNVRFHNGDPFTADDVKFSFERYKGAAATILKARVARVDVVDPHRVRFVLKQAWPDFLTFYGTPATGAAWIVPKKYVEKVGDEGFKKAPVGAGPYKFVSFRPGVELTLEAFEQYWRKSPSIKTLVMKVIPDESTRLAALKNGEVDLGYSITGPLAEEVKRTPGLILKPTYLVFTAWLNFSEQWDPKSPWHDKRVRQAANLAIDRKGINDAAYLGLARLSSGIIPHKMDYYWEAPAIAYDPARAKKLLAEAGFPNGFDAGELVGDTIYGTALGEPAVNSINAVGIRLRLRVMERAAYYKQYADKTLRGVLYTGSAAFGNAATRIENYAVSTGAFAYGGYPEIDGLFSEQTNELNPRVRQQVLHKIQQIITDRVMFAPIMEPAFLNGVGPRVDNHGLNAIAGFAYSAPYEDLKLKKK